MKRNFECMNKVLLYLELSTGIKFKEDNLPTYSMKEIDLPSILSDASLSEFDRETIAYSLHQLYLLKYIDVIFDGMQIKHVIDVTPIGHDKLQTLHNNSCNSNASNVGGGW